MTRRVIAIVGLAVALPSAVDAQAVRLVVRDRPQLVECRDRPCVRIDVYAADAQGRTVNLNETESFQVLLDGRPLVNLYPKLHRIEAEPGKTGPEDSRVPRVWLVLFDTSGSMNTEVAPKRTRFQEAIAQLPILYQNFRENLDQMAIAPFASQGVSAGIRNARFETTFSGIQRSIQAIVPTRTGNTALYSAVVEGLRVLQPRRKSGAQVTLVVFTDGENDIRQPADDNLLGNDDLDVVIKTAGEVGATIRTVGFGAGPRMFNEAALRRIAYPSPENYLDAKDPTRLKSVFSTIVEVGNRFVRILTGPLPYRRDDLMNLSLEFEVRTANLSGRTPPWIAPPTSPAVYESELTATEKVVVSKWPLFTGGPSPAVFRLIVVATYGAVLALLWFGMPRLIWPERYAPKPPAHSGAPRPGPKPSPRPSGGGARPGQRPEVTIPSGQAPRPSTGGPGPARRTSPPAPPKTSEPPPRPAEALGPRESTDATVFIPPKKPGGRS